MPGPRREVDEQDEGGSQGARPYPTGVGVRLYERTSQTLAGASEDEDSVPGTGTVDVTGSACDRANTTRARLGRTSSRPWKIAVLNTCGVWRRV